VLASAPVAPLAPHPLLVFLLQVAVLLLLALCLGKLASRLNMPAIVGELLAGVLIGPSLLGHAVPNLYHWLFPAVPEQVHLLDAVGQVAVLLLVGITGAQLDLSMLRRRGATAVRVSLAGLLVPLTLGVSFGYALPASQVPNTTHRVVFAVFLGVAMCVSAIPVISKTLSDMNLLHRDVGQLTLASGMVDDAVGWFLLSIVSAMATIGIAVGRIGLSVLYLFGFIAAAALVGRPITRVALRLAARSSEPGTTVATAVVIILLGASVTHSLGMEPVFGAFVGGILVGRAVTTDRARLAPLRTIVLSFLAPIFMASAGLRIDLTALRNPAVLLSAILALSIAILGKFTGAYLGARSSRLSQWEALGLGAGMNARGVVEVVVAMVGLRLGVLSPSWYTIIVLVAIVTSLMAPPMLRFAMSRVEHSAEEQLRLAEFESWTSGTANSAAEAPGAESSTVEPAH
jgi:K+:H+ antiporter